MRVDEFVSGWVIIDDRQVSRLGLFGRSRPAGRRRDHRAWRCATRRRRTPASSWACSPGRPVPPVPAGQQAAAAGGRLGAPVRRHRVCLGAAARAQERGSPRHAAERRAAAGLGQLARHTPLGTPMQATWCSSPKHCLPVPHRQLPWRGRNPPWPYDRYSPRSLRTQPDALQGIGDRHRVCQAARQCLCGAGASACTSRLQLQDSDLLRIVKRAGLNIDAVEQDLVRALDRLPHGATSISDISEHVDNAVERAWVYASLRFEATSSPRCLPACRHREDAGLAAKCFLAFRASSTRSCPNCSPSPSSPAWTEGSPEDDFDAAPQGQGAGHGAPAAAHRGRRCGDRRLRAGQARKAT